MEQSPERTEKSFSFQGLREAYPPLDWPKMQLCCMSQLTCFYNSVGFTFAFKMFMFILISNYVYSLLQPPFFSLFYFMIYTYPIFVHFYVKVKVKLLDMFLGGQDYLLILCQANLLPIFEFFVQELMLSLLFLLLFFRLLPTWYKACFIGIFYVTLLV